MSSHETAVPKGSWVLVSGANGFVASHIIQLLLQLGFKVRGTVREPKRAAWLTTELFPEETKKGTFDLFQVPDMAAENAFDAAAKGMSAICHVATVNDFSGNPDTVVGPPLVAVKNALAAAEKTPSVKRFVMTSSAPTTVMPLPGVPFHVTENSWNDMAVELASTPPYGPEKGLVMYLRGKIETEKYVWSYLEDKKPDFAVNVVSPFAILGPLLSEHQSWATPTWAQELYHGDTTHTQILPCGKSIIPKKSWHHRSDLTQDTSSTLTTSPGVMWPLCWILQSAVCECLSGTLRSTGMMYLPSCASSTRTINSSTTTLILVS